MDVKYCPTQCQELLAGNRFGMQGQLGLDVEPGVEAATLDSGKRPNGLDGFQHTLLAVTDNVRWCRNQ
jgi:hypothetical protein